MDWIHSSNSIEASQRIVPTLTLPEILYDPSCPYFVQSIQASLFVRSSGTFHHFAASLGDIGDADFDDAVVSFLLRHDVMIVSPSPAVHSTTHHSKTSSLSHPAHQHTANQTDPTAEDEEKGLLLPKVVTTNPAMTSLTLSSSSLSSSANSASLTLPTPASSSAPPPSWFRRKLVIPLFEVLKSGATPEGIALSLAFGLTGGVFPIPTVTTVACIVLAWLFALNFPAVQLTNLLMTPVNFATFIPFIRVGEWLFGVSPAELSLSLFQSDPLQAISLFWISLVRGVVAWLVFLPPATALLYIILKPIIKRVMTSMKFT